MKPLPEGKIFCSIEGAVKNISKEGLYVKSVKMKMIIKDSNDILLYSFQKIDKNLNFPIAPDSCVRLGSETPIPEEIESSIKTIDLIIDMEFH
mgnify:CR=1 FL=1